VTLYRTRSHPYIGFMKRIASLALILSLMSAPAMAEEEDNRSLMEEGLELFMEGLRKEMAPAMDDLRDLAEQMGPSMRSFLQEMGPAFAEMLDEVRDWSSYHPPEVLPNGDIIIRKKQVEPETPQTPAPQDDPPPGMTDI